MALAPLCWISVTPSATHNQTGPLWCWFPSGWAYARPRPLSVSPTTSPMRLGVSPAAAPTPTGVFSQRFEALFPHARALGCMVCFAPRRLSGLSMSECGAAGCYLPLCLPRSPPLQVRPSRFICTNVGLQGLLVLGLPAPFVQFICGRMWCRKVLPATLPAPLSATLSPALWVYLCKCGATGSASAWTACTICPTLRQSQSRHSHASPLHPSAVSAPPTSLDE